MVAAGAQAAARGRPRDAGWLGLFRTAFRSSQNPMALADDKRSLVDVNRACLALLGYRRQAVLGQPLYAFVRGGPLFSDEEWQVAMLQEEITGEADLLRSDGSTIRVQFAAHPELITGRRLILFVALSVSRAGRHFRREVSDDVLGALSEREREVVRLIALGASGPEIAAQLHISHNTVRTHVQNAMTKLGARSRAQLVAKALGEGHVLN